MKPYLRADLAKYGPEAGDTSPLSLAEARAYCRMLAQAHYENFSVSHFLLRTVGHRSALILFAIVCAMSALDLVGMPRESANARVQARVSSSRQLRSVKGVKV